MVAVGDNMQLVYIVAVLCLSCRWWQRSAAQYFRDPSITFKNITFDSAPRGSYNISQCVRDHINCWELIKPDLVCDEDRGRHMESVCSMMRTFCDDVSGLQEFENRFKMMESWCDNFERTRRAEQERTSEASTPRRLNTTARALEPNK